MNVSDLVDEMRKKWTRKEEPVWLRCVFCKGDNLIVNLEPLDNYNDFVKVQCWECNAVYEVIEASDDPLISESEAHTFKPCVCGEFPCSCGAKPIPVFNGIAIIG